MTKSNTDYKIVHLTKLPAPYRLPLFERINQQPGIELVVVYLTDSQPNRFWQVDIGGRTFREILLSGIQFFVPALEWPIHLTRGVFAHLCRERPDAVVVTGYESLAFWQALLYCKLTRCRFVLWSGATLNRLRHNHGLVQMLRSLFLRNADGFLAYGTRSREFLEHWGVPVSRIHVGYNTVDMEFWARSGLNSEIGSQEIDRRMLRLLYVGLLIPLKRVDQILQALSLLTDLPIEMTIIGEGRERARLEEMAHQLELKNIKFLGFKQYDELPPYYRQADAFVFPSKRDIWGLVVNEALASGLPVICSELVGACPDLLDSSNSVLFNPHDVSSLVEAIREFYERRREFRTNRRQISEQACRRASLDQYAQAFIKAATYRD